MSITKEEVVTTLTGAADYIDVHGWIQGTAEDDEGHVCALGAIDKAAENLSVEDIIRRRAIYYASIDAVRKHIRQIGVSHWNDEEGRVAEEVTAMLRETAEDENALHWAGVVGA